MSCAGGEVVSVAFCSLRVGFFLGDLGRAGTAGIAHFRIRAMYVLKDVVCIFSVMGLRYQGEVWNGFWRFALPRGIKVSHRCGGGFAVESVYLYCSPPYETSFVRSTHCLSF